ncbi:MAG: RES family NAD+ phosphorylase [Actinobacteria bacterium]|nr:RES family NAD+ phosphorylase [Actinomycetota bacterium]
MSRSWPPLAELRWDDTHRLIPDAYAHSATPVLASLAQGDDVALLTALAQATSRRVLVQQGAVPSGIHADELVFGVPEWEVVNAAFCYPQPQGSRFNGPHRGAWYAGRDVATSIAEVAFHRSVELHETGWFDLQLDYADFLSDLHGHFHDLRGTGDRRARACLHPASYERSQALALDLVESGSLGVVYPAVRHPGGEAVACFRPATVNHVRRGARFRFSWHGPGEPSVQQLSERSRRR